MVFSSIAFLCAFLPVTFLLAVVVRKTSIQNVLLLIASMLFYAYGEPVYLLLMIAESLLAYAFGLAIGNARHRGLRKALAAVSIVVCLGALFLFKYADWAVSSIDAAFGIHLPLLGFGLPVGISFYTFQVISYIVDVYRKDTPPQGNIIKAILYVSFFPQLIAGPIIRYHDIDQQLTDRVITFRGASVGLRRFIVGLAKKVLVADVMAKTADAIFAADASMVNFPIAWLGALAYLIQIYFDFSAYSDMAIGMARMFGFSYKENFNYPYISTSIQEFWRRWHISLSTWLREYLYIPLGGNRKGRLRTVFNKVFVFVCCGIWHGAAWTFVIWGLIHGLFLLLEEYLPIRKLPKPLGWLYCILVVTFAFVLFRADSLEQGMDFWKAMIMFWQSGWPTGSWELLMAQLTPLFLFSFIMGVVFAFPVLPAIKGFFLAASPRTQQIATIVCDLICICLLVICVLTLAGGAYSAFIYFRF